MLHLPSLSLCRQGMLSRIKSSKERNKLMKNKTIPCDEWEEARTVYSSWLIIMQNDGKLAEEMEQRIKIEK